ncbi:MAG: hypothetical protein KatS3mg051_0870 [Anaerolineae bacterium]|nr:MAG: hypothetical protein KatS3mg051_0870 [Anaerolineae bacterium]
MDTPLRIVCNCSCEQEFGELRQALERVGYAPAFQQVTDESALLRHLADRPDLVLACADQPGLDAERMLKQARGLSIPLIVVTAEPPDAALAAAWLQRGADDCAGYQQVAHLVLAVQRALSRRQMAQRAAEQRFGLLLDHLHVPVFIATVAGRVIYGNRAFWDLFQWVIRASAEAGALTPALQQTWERFVAGNQQAVEDGALVDVLHVEDATGEQRAFEVHRSAIFVEEGDPLIGAIALDVTEAHEGGSASSYAGSRAGA